MNLNVKRIKSLYTDIPLPAKAAIWFTVCNFILKGISFITVPIFTRLIPPDEYGRLSVFTSYEQVILIFATWEIQLGAYQKGIFKYKDDIKLFTSSTQALVNILTFVCFAIILIFNKPVMKFTEMNGVILTLLFVYLLFQPSYNCWLIRKRTKYEYRSAVTVTIAYTLVNVIVPMLAILIFQRTANFKFGATMVGSALFCLVIYLFNADYRQLFGNKDKVKEFWKFCIVFEAPVVLHSLSYLILNQADRVMISKMVGNSQAAFYSVAYSLAVVVSILQNSINQSLLPWRYEQLEKKQYRQIRVVTSNLLLVFACLISLFILVAPEIMKILFTNDYYDAVWSIPPVASGVFFMFLYTIFVNIETYYEKTKYITYVSIFCGLVNIALNYICIKLFGYIACGYTTLFSYILFSVGHYYFMKKVLKAEGIKENVVDITAVVLISVAVLACTVIFTLLYNLVFVRYALFVCILAVGFVKRNDIKKLIANIRK